MRVYYFTSTEHGISNIKNKRIKISLLDDLNDPYEFLGLDLSGINFSHTYQNAISSVKRMAGIISFTSEWKNPLLWSHYADKHKGICLGFDVDDRYIRHVNYVGEVMPMNQDVVKRLKQGDENLVRELITTKSIHWKYEEEVRVIVPLEELDVDTEKYFTDFEGNLELREVILGYRSPVDKDVISKYVDERNISVFKAGLSKSQFEIIREGL